MIHKILLLNNIKIHELNCIAFSKGPGNFTGIRIATGIAQSLSLSLKIPILGISTLAIMAEQAWRKYCQKKFLVSIYANTNKVYWGEYIKDHKFLWLGEKTERLLDVYEMKKKIKNFNDDFLLITNGWEKINDTDLLHVKKIHMIFPNAKDIIPFALFHIKNQKFLHATEVTPNYLNNIF